uniref:Uncharacterized protein n=1 Tax=Aegilops tauschii subsp. strangulata TaxID=200361 RepID=A0A453PAI6_AEGTS
GEGKGRAEAHREQDQSAGHLLQAPQRPAQEGLRALRALRRRGGAHHLLQPRQALRVRQRRVHTYIKSTRSPPFTTKTLERYQHCCYNAQDSNGALSETQYSGYLTNLAVYFCSEELVPGNVKAKGKIRSFAANSETLAWGGPWTAQRERTAAAGETARMFSVTGQTAKDC